MTLAQQRKKKKPGGDEDATDNNDNEPHLFLQLQARLIGVALFGIFLGWIAANVYKGAGGHITLPQTKQQVRERTSLQALLDKVCSNESGRQRGLICHEALVATNDHILTTKQDIQEGSLLLQIPSSLYLADAHAPYTFAKDNNENIKVMVADKSISAQARLALLVTVLSTRKVSSSSSSIPFWNADKQMYLEYLPTQQDLAREFPWMFGNNADHDVVERYRQQLGERFEAYRQAMRSFQEKIKNEYESFASKGSISASLEDYTMARLWVSSRSFATPPQMGASFDYALVPLLDSMNHDDSLTPNVEYKYNPATQTYQALAKRHVRAGEPLTIQYFAAPASWEQAMSLTTEYGFIPYPFDQK